MEKKQMIGGCIPELGQRLDPCSRDSRDHHTHVMSTHQADSLHHSANLSVQSDIAQPCISSCQQPIKSCVIANGHKQLSQQSEDGSFLSLACKPQKMSASEGEFSVSSQHNPRTGCLGPANSRAVNAKLLKMQQKFLIAPHIGLASPETLLQWGHDQHRTDTGGIILPNGHQKHISATNISIDNVEGRTRERASSSCEYHEVHVTSSSTVTSSTFDPYKTLTRRPVLLSKMLPMSQLVIGENAPKWNLCAPSHLQGPTNITRISKVQKREKDSRYLSKPEDTEPRISPSADMLENLSSKSVSSMELHSALKHSRCEKKFVMTDNCAWNSAVEFDHVKYSPVKSREGISEGMLSISLGCKVVDVEGGMQDTELQNARKVKNIALGNLLSLRQSDGLPNSQAVKPSTGSLLQRREEISGSPKSAFSPLLSLRRLNGVSDVLPISKRLKTSGDEPGLEKSSSDNIRITEARSSVSDLGDFSGVEPQEASRESFSAPDSLPLELENISSMHDLASMAKQISERAAVVTPQSTCKHSIQSKLLTFSAHAPIPVVPSICSTGEPSLPFSMNFLQRLQGQQGSSETPGGAPFMPDKGKSPSIPATPLGSNASGSTDAQNLSFEERFLHLQAFLRFCDEADQKDLLQALRSLSAVARSGHAFNLEARALRLSIAEGKEMVRLKMLNVMGKGSPGPQSSTVDAGATPIGSRLPAPGTATNLSAQS